MSNNKEEKDAEKTPEEDKKPNKFSFSLSLLKTPTTKQTKIESNCSTSQPSKTDSTTPLRTFKAGDKSKSQVDGNSFSDSSSNSNDELKPVQPIKLKLTPSVPKLAGIKRPAQEGKKIDLSDVFNSDEQPEVEEMPLEAKMRMRNIGKDTPTASGPNSFNKGKLGFCNQAKMLEKQLKLAFEPPEKSKKKFY